MWNLKKMKSSSQIQGTDWWLPGVGVGNIGKGSQDIQASSYKINKSQRYNEQHGDLVNNSVLHI